MSNSILRAAVGLLALLSSQVFGAAASSTPEVLRGWTSWALHGQEQKLCPITHNNGDEYHCGWPQALQLRVDDRGAQLTQYWTIAQETWIELPGDTRYWPLNVMDNQRRAVVVTRDGKPAVQLGAGEHLIEARYQWNEIPEFLRIPTRTGIVQLNLRGKAVPFPAIETDGRLWLQAKTRESTAPDERADIAVYRRLEDSIPARVTTRIELDIAGKAREISLSASLGSEFTAFQLESALPARLDADGRLRVQVRPGHWTVDFTERHHGPLSALKRPGGLVAPWPENEIWAVAAHPELRVFEITGIAAIDPKQTSLPAEWQGLPAYRVTGSDVMTFEEKQRGEAVAAPDTLALERNIWLRFDGAGYFVQDSVSGTKNNRWRMDLNSPFELGRVAVNGRDHAVTRLGESGPAGIELRQGQVNLVADSIINNPSSTLPAVGWSQDFASVSSTLHLPPGWSLFAARGVDSVHSSWVGRWTLLDFFVVLVAAFGAAKLFGRPAGALALLTLALTYHDADAPRWVWLHLLVAAALISALPVGKLKSAALYYRGFTAVALLLIAVPFFVHEIRTSIYPQLENVAAFAPLPSAQESYDVVGDLKQVEEEAMPAAAPLLSMKSAADRAEPRKMKERKNSYSEFDPSVIVQTGPGIPEWRWSSVSLRWSGPVSAEQEISLYLISPLANSILGFAKVGLIVAFALAVFGVRYRRSGGWAFPPARSWFAPALLLLIPAFFTAPDAQADIPDAALREELKSRLVEKPQCLPNCAQIESMRLAASDDALRIELVVHAATNVAIPVPATAAHWRPARAMIDQRVNAGSERTVDGRLLLHVPAGVHVITLEGPIPPRDSIALDLPLLPHQVIVDAPKWLVSGVHDDGRIDSQLHLSRRTMIGKRDDPASVAATLPTYLEVERVLRIGLQWRVETTVTRITPLGAAVLQEVPLLKGESVLTDGIRVRDGRAQINMGPNERTASWSSLLDVRDQLVLMAADTLQYGEVWRVEVSPVWHLETDGLTPVFQTVDNQWFPQWRPWPKETVTLKLQRPVGVPGQTVTIDQSNYVVTPGLRSTNFELTLRIRSGQGAQHRITLPDGVVVESQTVNGAALPPRVEGRDVILALTPGTQNIVLKWRDDTTMSAVYHTPAVGVGAKNVNHHLTVNASPDRWSLFLGGPQLGPAILFYGVLIVAIVIAVVLSRWRDLPLNLWQWVLLSIGLTQVPVAYALVVVSWFIAFAARAKYIQKLETSFAFSAAQIGLAGLTAATAMVMVYAISRGLLGVPDMAITGNGSNATTLRWFQDASDALLPQAWIVSVPMWVYRVLMLAWALWVASAIVSWIRWGWLAFSAGGYWRSVSFAVRSKKAPPASLDTPQADSAAKEDKWTSGPRHPAI